MLANAPCCAHFLTVRVASRACGRGWRQFLLCFTDEIGEGGARLILAVFRALAFGVRAGSERKEDSALHNAERRKEGAEINQSLHALKARAHLEHSWPAWSLAASRAA
eukprot:6210942-Pleurochrysis_carterae.AAC.1